MSGAVTTAEAARVLGISTRTLRRWITRENCPTIQRGERGRGKSILVDADQVREWRKATGQNKLLIELASCIPNELAIAAKESLRQVEGRKDDAARALSLYWYIATDSLLNVLRSHGVDIPVLTEPFPPEIEYLRRIGK